MRQLHTSDLKLLLHLFAAKQHRLHIVDVEGRLVKDEPIATNEKELGAPLVAMRSHPAWALNEKMELIIDLGAAQPIEGYLRTVLHTITHADGRLRWMYPQGRLASVLHFHNAAGFRAKTMAWGIRLADALGLERWVRSGTITLHHRAPLKFDALLSGVGHTHRSFFMGTPGAQRKITIVLEHEGRPVAFAKVATNKETLALLKDERDALREVQNMLCPVIRSPREIVQSEPALLVLTNISSADHWRSNTFAGEHAQAVVGLANGRVVTGEAVGHLVNARLNHRLRQLSRMPLNGVLRRVSDLLHCASSSYGLEDGFTTAPAHGDFTPWNMHCSSKGLAVYDWELFEQRAPALYDLMHFHMQQGIIVDRVSFHTIRERILTACELPGLRTFIMKHGLEVDACIRHYLIESASRFLLVYACQSALSTTQLRQLFAWESALAEVIAGQMSTAQHRVAFLEDLTMMMNGKPHAFLKFRWNELTELPAGSDVDMVTDHRTAMEIAGLVPQHPFVRRARVVRKSFMRTVEIFFHDGGFLSLDLIHRFQRKHLRMLDAGEVLREAEPNAHGLQVPAFKHDLVYSVLFSLSNGASVPEKYHQPFAHRTDAEWLNALVHLNERCGLWFLDRSSLLNADASVFGPVVRKALAKRMTLLERLTERVNYVLDTLRGMTSGRGFIVTFSGVDGAGKSTVIAQVKKELEGTFRREVVLMRHRPGLLPMLNAWRVGAAKAEEIATRTLPRTGTNKGAMSSLLRFAYYFLDYAIGQWVVYFRHVLRGRIVLYDRYYFDFMADPCRSNIQLSREVINALYAFVHAPKLNFFLYADSATILHRKQELSAADVELLTQRYRSLFDRLSNRAGRSRYHSICNEDLATTLSGIRYEIANAA